MPSASTLKDLYIEEMRDLWSANDQMQRLMQSLSDRASDPKLKEMLTQSVGGIGQHTATLKSILEAQGGSIGKEHCKGMEGLVAEAKKHAFEGQFDEQLRDLVIIAQYQRMCHYGLAGFGAAAAYASALGLNNDVSNLKRIMSDIYKADEYTTKLAEHSERAAAKAGGSQGNLSSQGSRSGNEGRVESGYTVGRTVPDQSKERNTEIAVEAGHEGAHPEDRR